MDRRIKLTDDFLPVSGGYKNISGRYVGILWVAKNPNWSKLTPIQAAARTFVPFEAGESEPVLLLDSCIICLS